MSFLALVLALKIAVIGFVTAIPFLTFPVRRLDALTGVTGGGKTLFRLYGIAISALLVGYASGFWVLARGEFPWGVVAMGIVSNGGAATVLLGMGAWRRTLPIAVFLVAITAALVAAAITPSFAMRSLW